VIVQKAEVALQEFAADGTCDGNRTHAQAGTEVNYQFKFTSDVNCSLATADGSCQVVSDDIQGGIYLETATRQLARLSQVLPGAMLRLQ